MQWENVHIFISSTFNDMHAERDYLVKSVFPALAEWCEERKLRLIDIDLRWGVTAADAEAKNTVRACLRNIDECRPFFLCFLGQRRGWVPNADDIEQNTYEQFPNLASKMYVGKTSVTEMEILHALVDPLHGGILRNTKDDSRSGGAAEYAFFYLRNPEYLNRIPHPDLRAVYTNEAERDPAAADKELSRWREQEIPQTGRPVYSYAADWRMDESTPEIALPLCVPTTAPKESDAWKNAYAGWKKKWAAVGVDAGENSELTGAELEKAKAYNAVFANGRLGNFQAGDCSLADVVIEQLKTAIAARYPAHMAIDEQTPLQKEIDQQAQFLRLASEGFIERAGDFDALNAYLQNTESRPFAVTAYAGMGKTSLLAHFIDTLQLQENESLHYRFIGGSDDSVNTERLVRSLLQELKEAGKLGNDIPLDSVEMMNKLPELLEDAGTNGKTILVIDALNQLESGMDDLHWIPFALPENVKLIVSFKRGGDRADEYYSQQEKSCAMILHNVRPFDSLADRKALVAAYLEQYFKELDEPRIQAMVESDGAENPLFLKVALSELRVFGVHNDLSEIIRTRFGNTPAKAFHAVLERMENDPAYTELEPSVALPHVLGWMAHSRYGLSAEELADLLVRENLAGDKIAAFDSIYLILRQLRPFLAKRDGRVDFFYESFKIAATERYAKDHAYARPAQEWHRSLAEYFATLTFENRHRLMEQAWQYAMAGMEESYQALLFDYRFIEARLTAFDVNTLISDHEHSQEELIGLLKECHQLSAHVLSAHKEQLPCQLWGRMADLPQKEIRALLEQVVSVKRERGEPWLRPHVSFSEMPGGALHRTIAGEFVALAFVNGRVHGLTDNSEYMRFDALSGKREAAFTFNPKPHGYGKVYSDFSQDASLIATADNDKKTISIVDIATREIRELKGYTENVCGAAFLNGRRLLFSKGNKYLISMHEYDLDGKNTFVHVWDIESKKCLYKKDMAGTLARTLEVMPDGERFIAATDTEIKILRIKTGKVLKTRTKEEFALFSCLRGGQIYASTPEHPLTIELRDIDTDKLLYSFEAPGYNRKEEGSLVLNDKLFIARDTPMGHSDLRFLSVIDLKTGTTIRNYPAEIFYNDEIHVDGNFAVTHSSEEVLIWNLFRNASERRNMDYSDEVAIDSKGELAILQSNVLDPARGSREYKLIAFDIAKNQIRHVYEPDHVLVRDLRLINNDRHISFIDGWSVVYVINTQTGAVAFKLDPLDCPDIFDGGAPARVWSEYAEGGNVFIAYGALYAEDGKLFLAYGDKTKKRDYVSVWEIATGKLLHEARLEYKFKSFMLAEGGKSLVVTQTTPQHKPPEVSDEDYLATAGCYLSVYSALNMKRLRFERFSMDYHVGHVLLSAFGQHAMLTSRHTQYDIYEHNIETGEGVDRATTKITEAAQLEQTDMLRFSFDDDAYRKAFTVSAYDMSGDAPFKELASIHTDGLASPTFAHNREGAVRIACCSNTKQMLFFTLENVFWKGHPESSAIDFGTGEAQRPGLGHISYPAAPPADARAEEPAAFEWDTPVPAETQTIPAPRPPKNRKFLFPFVR